jgi:hypothetical protein
MMGTFLEYRRQKFVQLTKPVQLIHLLLWATVGVFGTIGCNYKSPATENPAPTDEGIAKSFFTIEQKDPKTGKMVTVPRTFLCGWVSEMETGRAAQWAYTNNHVVPDHCNLVFEITQTRLIGRQINPSFPEDPSRWEIALTFPITSHYYYEKEKDPQGRETNRFVKNSSRSHWSARTHIDLNLEGMSFGNLWQNDEASSVLRMENSHVDQIEWDAKNNFFAFSLISLIEGSNHARLRFNFKSFEHDSTFTKTPFNDKNYKKMNVLHVVGEKVNGIHQVLHAAHWDLRKKHEIRLWKVPEKWKPVVKEIVQDWNNEFKAIGATTEDPFTVSDEPALHSFDLRHSTIAWVEDEKVSSYSPLGIGMALADVKNGEIKSGLISIFGGTIEQYVKSFSIDLLGDGSGDVNARGDGSGVVNARGDGDTANSNKNAFGFLNRIPRTLAEPKMMSQMNYTPDRTLSIVSTAVNGTPGSKKQDTFQVEEKIQMKNQIAAALPGLLGNHFQMGKSSEAGDDYRRLLINSMSKEFAKSQANSESIFNAQGNTNATPRKTSRNKSDYRGRPLQCGDRTFRDIGRGWFAAKEELPQTTDREEKALRSVIKELLTHEYGHFLGLGHQFKENILPAKGSVPDSIFKALAEKAQTKKMTHYSSVMGYRSAVTEVNETSQLLPGPHDRLVLRYLYRQEFPTYKQGDSDFAFHPVPESGVIPDNASYFPQCNDLEASISMDPFCNRFDRGYSATTITQSYIDSVKQTQMDSLFSFSDSHKIGPERYEQYLWGAAFRDFGRMRIFYDYMRLTYKDQIDQIRSSSQDLYDFSQECSGKDTRNENLKAIFKSNPGFKELCLANERVLSHFKEIVSGNVTDFTKMDPNNRYTPGGMRGGDADKDWSHFTGSWTEMTGVPFKIAALYTLSVGVPYSAEFGMMGVPLYDDPRYKFSYALLYPMKYLEIITANLKNNLRFAALNENIHPTEMGVSVSSLGWFQHLFNQSHNDYKLFPEIYSKRVRNSNHFDLSIVAVIMKGRPKEGSPNFMESFETKVLDLSTKKEFPASGYFLPGGQLIVSAPGMIVYPFPEFFHYSNGEGYSIAYKMDYSIDDTDPLGAFGPKAELKGLNDRLVEVCFNGTHGNNNGLRYFFGRKDFPGINMPDGIALEDPKKTVFLKSIEKAFESYYSFSGFSTKPSPTACQEALRGMGLIISSAAIMSGYWLPEAGLYIQK